MASQPKDRFGIYQHAEGRTGIGQMVEFTCPSGEIDTVRKFLLENVRTIRPPVTSKTALEHGWYAGYSRYALTQLKYAASMEAYLEVLQIADPPEDRWGIVLYDYNPYEGLAFSEWSSVKEAEAAFEHHLRRGQLARSDIDKLPGFRRFVHCGAMTPWFYAIGDEELVGDYTFPHGLQDDVTFRFGRKFLTYDWEGTLSVRTCMGTRFIEEKDRQYPYAVTRYRKVYWNDGTFWKDTDTRNAPRPVEDDELWIDEAIRQFRKFLAGEQTEFSIKLTDGNQFIGRLAQVNRRGPCAEGKYLLTLTIKGEAKPMQGWVEFKATPEAPDVVQFAVQGMAKKGKIVERVKVDKHTSNPDGKKWMGVYFAPSNT